jgi:hypothetical protein
MNAPNTFVRLLACIALVGTPFVVLEKTRPAWAAPLGLDWWTLPQLARVVRQAEAESEDLDRRGAAVLARINARQEVVRDLCDGRLTLLEAAARFRALNATAGATARRAAQDIYPGASEGERICRQVIGHVRTHLEEQSPGRGETVTRALEEELRARLEADGTVRLPE